VDQGYINRPALTAERFIPDPFSEKPGTRLYKTGDLARYLPDGQIAFMGRIDQQIKIRGCRIEPGEISSLLNGHPAVLTSFVIAREDTPGDKHLIAYIVLDPGSHTTASSLRASLKMHLPDDMIPTKFVLLDALPLTTNGSVDRAALPAPNRANTLHDEISSAPKTPAEERLVGIVAPLLDLNRLGTMTTSSR
jgi:acyl-coenzyme A synthetase/AMP-(fatty) acid ligase